MIGTGKRTGKTAVAGHWAGLLRAAGRDPVIVSMGRGGPPEPQVAGPETGLAELLALAPKGATLPRTTWRTPCWPGCARWAAAASAAARWRAGRVQRGGGRGAGGLPRPGRDRARGLGLVHPAGGSRPHGVPGGGQGRGHGPLPDPAGRPEPAHGRRGGGGPRIALRAAPRAGGGDRRGRPRGAVHHPGRELRRGRAGRGVAPTSRAGRRSPPTSIAPPPRAATSYLTELKAAAIDTVAERAATEGARVVFVRNRPVGLDGDLDAALMDAGRCLRRWWCTAATACPTRRG